MTKLGENLKQLMTAKTLSATQLARMSGVAQSQITRILTGEAKHPTIDTVVALAQGLNVSLYDLVSTSGGGIKVFPPEEPVDDSLYVLVPDVKASLSAGPGCDWLLEPEDEGAQVAYKRDFFVKKHVNPKNTFRMRVHGDSMYPYFFDGDSVLIERYKEGDPIRSGRIYAFSFAGELRVKRLRVRMDGKIAIESENSSAYHEELVSQEEFFNRAKILGRVIDRSGGDFL
ncbi:helix-turn-helix domain-containing protein [Mesosutterella sp. OilRF-GAM-744-9]|uniref:Helix-turn-helix domain-containing protein n=1 Tax=Mesosutterella porci TaxID=2915351 RepID=A0ABS9MST7_9BURK|nr:XRE family transcriptional regulator [Mesosutterella sp. oilRF-744-WT-GAM-9]MCG5031691.1 helix-turn-helix domain-containing protein [Mesosutterella sp. oilRF-744-WT-GAM-9]